MGYGIIDQSRPGQREDQEGAELYALHIAASDQGYSDDGKHGLKDHKGERGDGQALFYTHAHTVQAQEIQAAYEAGYVLSKGQGIAVQDPLQAYDAHDGKAEYYRGDGILLPDHAPVEESNPRNHD